MHIGEKLKAMRQKLGLKQAYVAKRAGIAPETLTRIEKGQPPTYATVDALSAAMGVTVADVDSIDRVGPLELPRDEIAAKLDEILSRLPPPRE